MNKNVVIGILAVIAIILLVLFAGGRDEGTNGDIDNRNGDRDDLLGEEVTHEYVRVDAPEAGDTVSSPFTLRGEARGMWYFEASFSVRFEGNDGSVLTEVPVQADGEWMTEEFVPFETTITWNGPAPEAGYIVLVRANPSGLPENAAEVRIPVFFESNGGGTQTVSVFFSGSDFGATTECNEVTAVTRTIPSTQAVARAAINELLKGPTPQEAQGNRVTTSIPEGVELNSIRVEDGTAFVDFSEELNQVGGSCMVTAIRAQIEETLMQFSTVEDVVISVEGNVDEALQP